MKKIWISLFYTIFKVSVISIPLIITFFIFNGINHQVTELTKHNLVYGLIFSYTINNIFLYVNEFKSTKDDEWLYYLNKFITFILIIILLYYIVIYGFNLYDLNDNINEVQNFLGYMESWKFKISLIFILLTEVFYNYHNSITVIGITSIRKKEIDASEEEINKINSEKKDKLNNILKINHYE